MVRAMMIVLALLLPAKALGHEKTDTVVLVNGDRLTGEIKGMEYGILSLSTDYLDTVEIEWLHISSVSSRFDYEVRTNTGQRHYGSLSPKGQDGSILVNKQSSHQNLAIAEIVELRPLGDALKDRLDVKISSGLSYNRASEVLQLNVQPYVEYQDAEGITRFSGRTTVTDTEQERTQSNRYSLQREYWTRRPNVVRWFSGTYEDNDAQALDYRLSAGGGFGRAFLDEKSLSLQGYAGLQVVNEHSQNEERNNSIEGVLAGRFSTWQFQTPELSLDTDLALYPGLTEWGRWRADADLSLNWEIVKDLYWDISAWWSYDNDSSEDGSDYGITTGLGWKY